MVRFLGGSPPYSLRMQVSDSHAGARVWDKVLLLLTLLIPALVAEPIWRTALELARPEVRGKRIRLLGVAATGLGAPEQISMFDVVDSKQRRVVEAADAVRRRFGDRAVTRASLLDRRRPSPFERDPASAVEGRVGIARIEDEEE